jgi:hypothetical protein
MLLNRENLTPRNLMKVCMTTSLQEKSPKRKNKVDRACRAVVLEPTTQFFAANF